VPPPASASRFDRCFNRTAGAALGGFAGLAALAAAVCNCGGTYGTNPYPDDGGFGDIEVDSRADDVGMHHDADSPPTDATKDAATPSDADDAGRG